MPLKVCVFIFYRLSRYSLYIFIANDSFAMKIYEEYLNKANIVKDLGLAYQEKTVCFQRRFNERKRLGGKNIFSQLKQ